MLNAGAPNPSRGWLMRTAWDYTTKSQEFLKWLKTLPADRCWNSPALMAWNVHKHYVLDLESCGRAVVQTELPIAALSRMRKIALAAGPTDEKPKIGVHVGQLLITFLLQLHLRAGNHGLPKL